MFNYAVVEIAGRQYKIEPGSELLVNHLGEVKTFECDKVLLLSEGDKISVGSPYLKEKLKFEVIDTVRGKKIRVATYKAKANTRKVKGSRSINSRIKLQS